LKIKIQTKNMQSSKEYKKLITTGDHEGMDTFLEKWCWGPAAVVKVHFLKEAIVDAAQANQIAMLKAMLGKYPDITFDMVEESLIHDAVYDEDIGRMGLFIDEMGGGISQGTLHSAIRGGKQEAFKFLLEDCRKDKIEEIVGNVELETAIMCEEWAMVERLKECGFVRMQHIFHQEPTAADVVAQFPDLTELGPKCCLKMC
jgi:hypothetical protein